jgi:hypothetical protein
MIYYPAASDADGTKDDRKAARVGRSVGRTSVVTPV